MPGLSFLSSRPREHNSMLPKSTHLLSNTSPRSDDLNGGELLPTCCSPAICRLSIIPLLFLLLLVKLVTQFKYLTNGYWENVADTIRIENISKLEIVNKKGILAVLHLCIRNKNWVINLWCLTGFLLGE